ncbi:glycosyltransferase 87 family protein [Kribbella sp. CA-253562]|uniref:glycosyltransferase 87 family protein n=1 Tax=Kribbella sp. CA-253562 TaxID=3239942 RepID=UPI003D8F7872
MLRDRRIVVLVGLLALLPVLLTWYAGSLDLKVYRTGGYAWLHGISLYSERFADLVPGIRLPFTYPPLAAILFTALYAVPFTVAELVMNAASVAGLTATLLVVGARLHGWNRRTVVIGLSGALVAMLLEPVRSTIGFGQVNLILMGLVALDCLLLRAPWPRGLLVGLAAAIKLTPAVFVVFFLVRRDYLSAAVSALSFAGFTALAWWLAPGDSRDYWFGVLFDPDRIGGATYAFNQCFQAVLARVMDDGGALWVALVVTSGALAWLAAWRRRAEGDDVTALLVVAVWGLLASPVSWSHHWVWIAPAALLAVRSMRWAMIPLAVFAVGPHTLLPAEGRDWSLLEHAAGSAYVLIGVAFLLSQTLKPRSRRLASGTPAG